MVTEFMNVVWSFCKVEVLFLSRHIAMYSVTVHLTCASTKSFQKFCIMFSAGYCIQQHAN
jgi:hypothetical protein